MRLNLINMRYFGYPNSDYTYDGEVKDNQPHGKGILKGFKDTLSFEGLFENGKPITGKLKENNDDIYEGRFTSYTDEDGTFLDGEGKIISKDGNIYTGGWCNGEKNGRGTMNYSDGRTFKGIWIDDAPSEGEMTYPNSIKYKGSFEQFTEIFSYGELNYPNGYMFKGSFEVLDDQNINDVFYECTGQIFLNGDFVKEGKLKLVDINKANFDKLMWPIP